MYARSRSLSLGDGQGNDDDDDELRSWAAATGGAESEAEGDAGAEGAAQGGADMDGGADEEGEEGDAPGLWTWGAPLLAGEAGAADAHADAAAAADEALDDCPTREPLRVPSGGLDSQVEAPAMVDFDDL
jgi:hypothetical protein